MSSIQLIDTFPEFLEIWPAMSELDTDGKIDLWHDVYLARWPQLRQLQIDDYELSGFDWRQVARERVFPFLADRLTAMTAAHDSLLKSGISLYRKAQNRLDFVADVAFVIYVGIGLGAGWVTKYRNEQAILFGLENIAECGYENEPILSGLVAHEIGHIAHFHLREVHGLQDEDGPWWQLYTEGFAQRCEHLILNKELWHMNVTDSGDEWLSWCQSNQRWLAARYLDIVSSGKPVNSFFGSWYDIQGHSQTGYFLGHEAIKQLDCKMSIVDIALLDAPDYGMGKVLEQIARGEAQTEE